MAPSGTALHCLASRDTITMRPSTPRSVTTLNMLPRHLKVVSTRMMSASPSTGNATTVTAYPACPPNPSTYLKLVSTRMMSVRLYSPVCFSCHTRSEDSRLKRPAVCTGVLPSMGPRSGPRPGRAPRERRDDSGAASGAAGEEAGSKRVSVLWGMVARAEEQLLMRDGFALGKVLLCSWKAGAAPCAAIGPSGDAALAGDARRTERSSGQ